MLNTLMYFNKPIFVNKFQNWKKKPFQEAGKGLRFLISALKNTTNTLFWSYYFLRSYIGIFLAGHWSNQAYFQILGSNKQIFCSSSYNIIWGIWVILGSLKLFLALESGFIARFCGVHKILEFLLLAIFSVKIDGKHVDQ